MLDLSNSQSMGSRQAPPGRGLFGWLGRQLGYVTRAIKQDPAGPTTVYRVRKVEEQPLPQNPDVKLRRTTIDEVIISRPVGPSDTANTDDTERA